MDPVPSSKSANIVAVASHAYDKCNFVELSSIFQEIPAVIAAIWIDLGVVQHLDRDWHSQAQDQFCSLIARKIIADNLLEPRPLRHANIRQIRSIRQVPRVQLLPPEKIQHLPKQ